MALTVKGDNTRPGGGFAVLEGPGLDDVSAISIENCYLGLYLGEDGRWAKVPAMLPVEPIVGPPKGLSLGPHIVDFIATDLQIGVRTEAGVDLGKVFWADIIPSRNYGAITARDVIAAKQFQTEERDRVAREAEDAKEKASRAEAAAREEAVDAKRRAAEHLAQQTVSPKVDSKDKKTDVRIPMHLVAAIAIPLMALSGVVAYLWPKPPIGPVVVPNGVVPHDSPVSKTDIPIIPPNQPKRLPETPELRPVYHPPVQIPSGLVPRGEQDASFTCRPDLDEPIAQLICADGDLAAADARMGRAFRQRFLSARSSDAKRSLMQEQHEWLVERDTTCDVPTTGTYPPADLAQYKPCVLRTTNDRTAVLERP